MSFWPEAALANNPLIGIFIPVIQATRIDSEGTYVRDKGALKVRAIAEGMDPSAVGCATRNGWSITVRPALSGVCFCLVSKK
jgi:hypothetical protein